MEPEKLSRQELLRKIEFLEKEVAILRKFDSEKIDPEFIVKIEERYQKLAENFPDTTITLYNRDLMVTFVTGQELVKTGKKAEEFIGKRFDVILVPSVAEKAEIAFNKALAGETSSFEAQSFGERYIRVTAVPVFEPDGSINEIQVISQNITERVMSEKRGRLWADAFYHSGHGIAIGLPDSNTILTCNEAFARIQGYSEKEIANVPILKMYAPRYHDFVKQCIAEADRTGHHQYEAFMVRKDGSEYPVLMDVVSLRDDQGKLLHRIVTQKDISERYASEAKIRESELRFSAIFQHSPAGISLVRMRDLQQVAINEACISIFGYSREEIVDRRQNLPELYDNIRDREEILSQLKNTGTIRDFEIPVIRKDGRKIEIRVSADLITIGDETYALVMMSDVTERKLAQEQLRASEQNYRYLFENNPLPMWTYHLESLRFLSVNDAAVEKYGFTRDEFLSMTIEDIRPEEELNRLRRNLRERRDSIQHSGTWKHRLKDGTIIDVDITSHLIDIENIKASLVVVLDVTEKKKNEEEIRRLSFAVEQSPLSILITDLDTRIIYVNDAFVDLTGFSRTELLGHTNAIYQADIHNFATSDTIFHTLQSGKLWKGVLAHRKKSGEIFYGNTSIAPITDENGKVINFLSMKLDVTNEILAEQKILQINEELELKVIERTADLLQINRKLNELNATKDKFFSIIAHDLRNPFNSILSVSEYLAKGGDTLAHDKSQRFINNIYSSAKEAYKLLENLLLWALSQTGNITFDPKSIPLNEIVRDTLEIMGNLATEKNITLTCQLDDRIMVFADRNMIYTVLRNLVTNAIKYTHKDGSVIVNAEQKEDEVVVSVIDNGVGIEEQLINKLFMISEKTSSPGTEKETGTGLGLVLCKEFVEKHEGRIWVESKPGKGSAFRFTLPAGDAN